MLRLILWIIAASFLPSDDIPYLATPKKAMAQLVAIASHPLKFYLKAREDGPFTSRSWAILDR